MRLENLLALTDGKLVNTPFVKQFTNIIFEAKKVKRGDLFIAFEEESIEEAVLNGAYGVMFDKPTQITDTEIAWIKVDEIDEALKRLLRFRLIEKEIVVYECNEIILKLALQVMSETNFIALEGDIETIYKTLWDLEDLNIILFSPALTSKDLFTDIKQFPNSANKDEITVMEQTLFETSFVYDDIFYERQLISPFFIPFLEDLFYFFKTLKINFRLRKFTPIDHFEAVFTNKNFEVKEFGTSDKVLIFEKSTTLIDKEIVFLQTQAPWAQIVYVVPQDIAKELEDKTGILGYSNTNEILNILKTSQFHFALIVGASKDILTKPLTNQAQISLFDFH
jgi:ferrochelatase